MPLRTRFTDEANERRLEKYPPVEVERFGEKTEVMNPVTRAIVFGTMSVAIGDLNENTAAEFYARLSLLDKLDGPYVRRFDEDAQEWVPQPITPEQVRDHIGLTANVAYKPADEWAKGLVEGRLKSARHTFREATGITSDLVEVYTDDVSGPEPVSRDTFERLKAEGLIHKDTVVDSDGTERPGWVFETTENFRSDEEYDRFREIVGY